jgi:hypothetical protein
MWGIAAMVIAATAAGRPVTDIRARYAGAGISARLGMPIPYPP